MSWNKICFNQLFEAPTRNGIYKTSEFHGRGTKIVNMGEIFAYDRIGSQNMERVELSEKEKEVSLLREGDLLFARRSLVESGAGKASIIAGLEEETTFESSVIRVRLDRSKCLPLFYLYWFKSYGGRATIQPLVTGVNVKGIRGSALAKVFVDYPPITVQKRIVDILSAYDDMIENNQKQIKLLEEAAQRIYKEWFVDMHFPGYECVPLINGVPKGWKRVTVGSLLGKVSRTTQIMTSNYLDQGAIPVIDQSRNFIAGYTNDETALVNLNTPVIVFGDHTRVLKYIQFPFAKGADGTQLILSNNERMPQSLLYCSLVNIDLSNYHYARHFKYLKAEETLLPTIEIATSFDNAVKLYFKKIQCVRNICIYAQETRNRFLPKLMSGEIEV